MASSFSMLRVRGNVRRLVFILGDQLDRTLGAFDDFDVERDAVLMMEVEEESSHVPSHRQRTALFLSAMRHFALELSKRGCRVHYVRLNDPGNTQSFDGEVRRQVARLKPRKVVCTHPGEWRVLNLMRAWSLDLDAEFEIRPDRHFLVQPEEFSTWAEGRKSLVMEHFYRVQRRRLGILVDGKGRPEGGRWNYDSENRGTFKAAPEIPRPYRARPDGVTREVLEILERRLPDLPGNAGTFFWPVTRASAMRALRDFTDERLANFGNYQDAMWTAETTVYHSRLGAALNLKLLRPMECVKAAVEAYHRGDAPLNAVEGFVRQIVGWREFIRGIYWLRGERYAECNALDHHGNLPRFYWTGETDMECLRQSVGQVVEEAYGHHIQRLMVTGNFALIAGINPKAVSDWYLGMYADAVDWVTLPNVLGMALYADGGVVGTKPYAASGKYINRMSNYCKSCRFRVTLRVGQDSCPFNALYWDFLIRHRERLRGNHRLTMILKNVDRLEPGERREIVTRAESLRKSLDIDSGDGPTPR